MGWGSGSEVMSEIIKGLKKKKYNTKEREKLYSVIIPALESADWDTQDECMDDDPAFAEALIKLHPEYEIEEE